MPTDLGDYWSDGYLLIRAGKPDWPQWSSERLPEKVVSISDHICPRLNVAWGWQSNRLAPLHFGIPEEKLDGFEQWCKKESHSELDYTPDFFRQRLPAVLSSAFCRITPTSI